MNLYYEPGFTSNDESDYLMHYGVLGMKWGIRRYENKDGTLTEAGKKHYAKTGEKGYKYHSWGTKHNQRKVAKMKKKMAKTTDAKKREKLDEKRARYQRRADRSAELDRREEQYARRVSGAKNLATRALLTPDIGGKPYQQYLAMLNGQKEKGITTKKLLSAVGSRAGGRLGSTAVKAGYIRRGEKEYIEKRRKRKKSQ